jgi:hypothetical protein
MKISKRSIVIAALLLAVGPRVASASAQAPAAGSAIEAAKTTAFPWCDGTEPPRPSLSEQD